MFREGEFLSAITLACAAEEPMAKMHKGNVGGRTYLEAIADAVRHNNAEGDSKPVSLKEQIRLINQARDWLKHYQDGSDLDLDAEDAARFMIQRAIVAYMMATRESTQLMRDQLRGPTERLENE